jgi:hypothetical protein
MLASGAVKSGALDQLRLPIFPQAIKECTTANSSPYLCSMDDFGRRYGTSQHRTDLINRLAEFVEGSRGIGVHISALLIGGSFIDRTVGQPADIDCLAFYGIEVDDHAVDSIICRWSQFRRRFPLDVKLCPADAGPITIIKRAIFFSNLFSIDKSSLVLGRGTILVELTDGDA